MKKYIPILFLLFLPLTSLAAAYQYYVPITVTSTQSIASGTNANYPMLVSSTLTQWIYPSHHITSLVNAPNGSQEPADLVFATSTANCGTGNLSYETESYTSSTGALVDWVNVPSEAAGTVIYACYDNSSITTDQSYPSGTWNSTYAAVYHFPVTAGVLRSIDSTANANKLINHSAASSTGEIDGGASFKATQYMNISEASSTGLDIPFTMTVEGWINPTTVGSSYQSFVSKGSAGTGWSILLAGNGNATDLYVRNNNSNTIGFQTLSSPIAANTWNYLVFEYAATSTSGANPIYAYLNGNRVLTVSGSSFYSGTSTAPLTIGVDGGTGFQLTGMEDEVRISNVTASSSLILTEYNNESSPSTFYAIGNETSLTPSATSKPTTAIFFAGD